MATVDVTTLTDQELKDLAAAVSAEQEKRYTLTVLPQTMNTMNANYLAAAGVSAGEPWVQPTGAHNAYPLDWEVTHNGTIWTSTVMSNVWEPGVANWREVVAAGGACPAWVQPTGAQDSYAVDDCVLFDGKCYKSLLDANTWSPSDYPAGWSQVPCS